MDETERSRIGLQQLNLLDAEAFENVRKGLEDSAPDMIRFIIEFGYGDIFSRPQLAPKTRQMITISALASLGNTEKQLKFHIGAALNIGVTPNEIIEALYIVTVFCGFPAGLNGIYAAQEVFSEKGVLVERNDVPNEDLRSRGIEALEETSKESGNTVLKEWQTSLRKWLIF